MHTFFNGSCEVELNSPLDECHIFCSYDTLELLNGPKYKATVVVSKKLCITPVNRQSRQFALFQALIWSGDPNPTKIQQWYFNQYGYNRTIVTEYKRNLTIKCVSLFIHESA